MRWRGHSCLAAPRLFSASSLSYTRVTPRRFARGAKAVAVPLGNALGTETGRGAGLDLDQAGTMLRMADDAGGGQFDRLARQSYIAKLFVLMTQFTAFHAAVQR